MTYHLMLASIPVSENVHFTVWAYTVVTCLNSFTIKENTLWDFYECNTAKHNEFIDSFNRKFHSDF